MSDQAEAFYARFAKGKKLSELTTLGIGGAARYCTEARDIADMQKLLAFAHSEKLPYLILGK